MPLLSVDNIELYYEQHGTGADLILLGGLSADHNVWKSTLRLFSSSFRVTILDNRGAGQSSTPDFPYTSELMANDVLQLMNTLHIDRAHILGHSMGGCIAQQIALIAPNRVNKCVWVCTRAKSNAIANMIFTTREKLENAGVSAELLAEYVLPFLFSESFLSSPGMAKGFIQWTLQNPFPQSAQGFKNQLNAVRTHNVLEKLHHVLAPTLIIAGEEDILMPVKDAEMIAKELKNSTFITIPGCAHMPHVEKSAEFAQTVLAFLNERN